jgi:glycosyltransferase involved in cell wall biosynthesis
MNILFIAPLPPPIHGQAYVSDVLLTELKKKHNLKVINCTKKRNAGKFYFFKRYFEVIDILYRVWKGRKRNNAVYITTSQSFLGNVKDLVVFMIFYNNLSKITIHLHGGAIKKELWDKFPALFNLNKYFISKMNAVIISGESHRYIYSDIIEENKIFIVPNFAMNEMFVLKNDIISKFNIALTLKVLYVSGMRDKKGYLDLFCAYEQLPKLIQNQISIDFAGEFESNEEKGMFIQEIKRYKNLNYHGVISDFEKINLFKSAHIFCLPTKYLEGQPISILEAYSSGCCVLTTNLGGISDIFEDGLNGFKLSANNSYSIMEKLEFCLSNLNVVREIACSNLELAMKLYKKDVFLKSISSIISFEK